MRSSNPGVDVAARGSSFDAVLAAARSGERRAFERLYHGLSQRVHAFARARRAADPEGVVNEVFLKVFTGLNDFAGSEAQFNAWVFTIARNRLIDEVRRRDRRPIEVPGDRADRERLAGCDDVEHQVIGRLATESMLARLDGLTVEQRDVVLLRVVSDLTVEAVAEVLGKEPGAVKALQRRAFRNIVRDFSPEAVPI